MPASVAPSAPWCMTPWTTPPMWPPPSHHGLFSSPHGIPPVRRTIAELETLAAIAVYSTYPSLIAGRRVSHFIDNTVALSALVHGYAGKPELAKSVNIFYLQMIGLRASVYFDYVPSKANIADLPSRNGWTELRASLLGITLPHAMPDTLILPSVSSWAAPLAAWVSQPAATTSRMPV